LIKAIGEDVTTSRRRLANNESSPVWDTFRQAESIYDLINMQFLCGKCSKLVMIQYSPAAAGLNKQHVSIKHGFRVPTDRDIRISNQFVITRALHFAQQAYYQASLTITLGRRV